MNVTSIQQLKSVIRDLLIEKGINKQNRKKFAERLGVTPTYISQIESPNNEKLPSLELIERMKLVLNLNEDEAENLKAQVLSAKQKKKQEKVKKEVPVVPESLSASEDALRSKISREEAIASIMNKLQSNSTDLTRFLASGFKGFDKLSDIDIQTFYNRYYLGLSTLDSVKVISSKPASRGATIQHLANFYVSELSKRSNEDLSDMAQNDLGIYVTVQGPGGPEEDELTKEAPVQDISGEGDLDSNDYGNDSYEEFEGSEDQGDLDSDDMVWVGEEPQAQEKVDVKVKIGPAPLNTLTQPPSAAPNLPIVPEAEFESAGFTPAEVNQSVAGQQVAMHETFSEMRDRLKKHNRQVSRSGRANPGLADDEADVRQEMVTTRRRLRGGVG